MCTAFRVLHEDAPSGGPAGFMMHYLFGLLQGSVRPLSRSRGPLHALMACGARARAVGKNIARANHACYSVPQFV